jgi:hypothetical protein
LVELEWRAIELFRCGGRGLLVDGSSPKPGRPTFRRNMKVDKAENQVSE